MRMQEAMQARAGSGAKVVDTSSFLRSPADVGGGGGNTQTDTTPTKKVSLG